MLDVTLVDDVGVDLGGLRGVVGATHPSDLAPAPDHCRRVAPKLEQALQDALLIQLELLRGSLLAHLKSPPHVNLGQQAAPDGLGVLLRAPSPTRRLGSVAAGGVLSDKTCLTWCHGRIDM